MDALRIAGHCGIVERLLDPFGHAFYLAGYAADLPRHIALSTPIGAFHVSEDFGAAVYASGVTCHIETVGDIPAPASTEPVRLFSIR